MRSVYIHSAACISAQPTFESGDEFERLDTLVKKVEAQHPNYKNYISPIALRRMATAVKMGVATAYKALKAANIQQPEAILTGTGMGCIEDTEKFLNAIIANDEEFLTPTSFIQSTHNTVGAQIALGLKCKSYNNTYVHGALSFESALMDAQLLLQNDEAETVLVGGVDEMGTEFVDAVRMMEDKINLGIKIPFGEGAAFFVLSSKVKNNAVKLMDLQSYSTITETGIQEHLKNFLNRNGLHFSDIEVLLLGTNGDGFDGFYEKSKSLFSKSTVIFDYKDLSGEFYTASSFGLYLGFLILESQRLPKNFLQNQTEKPLKNVVLYNQFKGRDHSFILLNRC